MSALKKILFRFTPAAQTKMKGGAYNFVVPLPPILPDIGDTVLLPGLESFEFMVVRRFWEFSEGKIVVALLLDVSRHEHKPPLIRPI